MFVDNLYLEEYHIGAVSRYTLRISDGSEFQLIRFAYRFKLITAAIRADCFQRAWLEINVVKSIKITVALAPFAE